MSGVIDFDAASGAISAKLSSIGEGASVQELSNEQLNQIATNLTNILQDVNSFAREAGSSIGAFQKVTLKLDENHYVVLGLSDGKVHAIFEEANKQKWSNKPLINSSLFN